MVDLNIVAAEFLDIGLVWPDHTAQHSRTMMQDRLFDYQCLRCLLEALLEEQAKERRLRHMTGLPQRPNCF